VIILSLVGPSPLVRIPMIQASTVRTTDPESPPSEKLSWVLFSDTGKTAIPTEL